MARWLGAQGMMKSSKKYAKLTPTMTSPTKKQKSETNFLKTQTAGHVEYSEGLNNSEAHSSAEL